jgi:adenosylcobinamide hydrolase
VLVWRPPEPALAISSGALGGGCGPRDWVLNTTVPAAYHHPDPAAHLASIAAELELPGLGVGLMTAVDVCDHVSAVDAGVMVDATVGIGAPAWAAAPDGDLRALAPGTINIVAWVPARLSEPALVNAVATVAEAKAQAMWDIGIDATGTASDAVCLMCPRDGVAEPYGGPRSLWGARLARAVHAAVVDAGRAWLSRKLSAGGSGSPNSRLSGGGRKLSADGDVTGPT